jgi:hypothetical protein
VADAIMSRLAISAKKRAPDSDLLWFICDFP